jgi:hypothetical protein
MKTKIGIVFHKGSEEQTQIANDLFKILYRDYDKPIEKGLMIDTYFIKSDEAFDLDECQSDFYIFLVDKKLALLDISNINYENSLIISYIEDMSKSKSFDPSKIYLNTQKEDLELGLFTFLARKLFLQKNLTLFLSHTKRDDIGEKVAIDYNTFISNSTKLKSFIDINDISYSDDIQKEIDENLESSIFVGFESDSYSDSKWTQYEDENAEEGMKKYHTNQIPIENEIPDIEFYYEKFNINHNSDVDGHNMKYNNIKEDTLSSNSYQDNIYEEFENLTKEGYVDIIADLIVHKCIDKDKYDRGEYSSKDISEAVKQLNS